MYFKNLYIYNYIRTLKKVSRMYKDKDLHTFYTTYIMAGKITIPFIYPLFKLNTFVYSKSGFLLNSKIEFVIIGILIFGLNYFFIEKRITSLITEFKKSKTKHDYFLHTIILILILFFFNLVLFIGF